MTKTFDIEIRELDRRRSDGIEVTRALSLALAGRLREARVAADRADR